MKTNMAQLKNWLDFADEDESGDLGTAKTSPDADSELMKRVDSLIGGRPAVLVTSSGSTQKKKNAMKAAIMAESTSGEGQTSKFGEMFVEFPRLEEEEYDSEEDMKYDAGVQGVKQRIGEVVAAKKKKTWGLSGMVTLIFGAGC